MSGRWNTFESSAARILEKAWWCHVLSHYPTGKVSTSHPFPEDARNFGRLQSRLCSFRVSLIPFRQMEVALKYFSSGYIDLNSCDEDHKVMGEVCLFEARPNEADGIRLSVSGRGHAATQRGGSWRFPAKTTGRSLSQREAKCSIYASVGQWYIYIYDMYLRCESIFSPL